ncbi:hypothetical protein BN1012_Phect2620 [Candidatus Phaeomarinobacter ectocarpi]|uniref:Uncharacterized protein n=1 Tax=Candidatus Phaeomarinibacter ectocarpi TaxID=1458461 RepID=X5MAG5_9HYPH|nr:hypothetical protein [Candidatus Phaeomarinobacter ectocarpi]CDO60833.1 hypothetical protein BN1012_Phect2620 [Candidatus Phaeomarinobacter ectocarpi]
MTDRPNSPLPNSGHAFAVRIASIDYEKVALDAEKSTLFREAKARDLNKHAIRLQATKVLEARLASDGTPRRKVGNATEAGRWLRELVCGGTE